MMTLYWAIISMNRQDAFRDNNNKTATYAVPWDFFGNGEWLAG